MDEQFTGGMAIGTQWRNLENSSKVGCMETENLFSRKMKVSLESLGKDFLGVWELENGRMVIIMKVNTAKDINKDQGYSLAESKVGNMMDNGKMGKWESYTMNPRKF